MAGLGLKLLWTLLYLVAILSYGVEQPQLRYWDREHLGSLQTKAIWRGEGLGGPAHHPDLQPGRESRRGRKQKWRNREVITTRLRRLIAKAMLSRDAPLCPLCIFLTMRKIIDKCVCEAQVYARVTQLRSANYTISVLMDWCIDVLMHKIDAKLKHEETWRTVETISRTITSWQVQNWCQVLMLRSTTSSSARIRIAQASISDRLMHQHIEVFHPRCSIIEQNNNLRITSQTNANALGSEETDNKTSISIGYWMYILDEPYLLRF